MARSMRRQHTWSWRFATTATLLLTMGLTYLSVTAWSELELIAVESAYASIFVATLGFNWILHLLLFLMLLFTLVWAIARPADIRGHGLAWLAELQGYFTAACWVLTFAVLYLTPRLW
jgi:heme/copper-type cytochrome/quinol oxidase subunit 3